ncbi:hypothetical protein ACIRBZ_43350 [Streptomyces sp. NPDC094038]|uniref:hypothetical protein n=1 Tax=Streptomyces sp. NPDC094038 TaxID=3366055 RepID=UPI003814B648
MLVFARIMCGIRQADEFTDDGESTRTGRCHLDLEPAHRRTRSALTAFARAAPAPMPTARHDPVLEQILVRHRHRELPMAVVERARPPVSAAVLPPFPRGGALPGWRSFERNQ